MKFLDSDLTRLGLGVLANNSGHYGAFAPALQGGMQDLQQWKALKNQQAWQKKLQDFKEQEMEFKRAQMANKPPETHGNLQYVGGKWSEIPGYRGQESRETYFGNPIFTDNEGRIVPYMLSNQGNVRPLNIPGQVLKPTKTVDTGGGISVFGYGGTSPVNEVPKTIPPEQTPTHKSAVTKAQEEAKQGVKKQSLRSKTERTASSSFAKTGFLENTIDKAIGQSSAWTTGFIGSATAGIPGTPAHDLANTLNTIKSNIGFDRLQEMRDASPTGGALGQVSEMENRLLQSTWGSVEQSQSKKQLEENLTLLKYQIRESWRRVAEAYEKDYGQPLNFDNAESNTEFDKLWDEL